MDKESFFVTVRVNVYQEELTTDVEIVTTSDTEIPYYGVRLFLRSAPELHNTELDDDRSAITIWLDDETLANNLRALLKEAVLLQHQ